MAVDENKFVENCRMANGHAIPVLGWSKNEIYTSTAVFDETTVGVTRAAALPLGLYEIAFIDPAAPNTAVAVCVAVRPAVSSADALLVDNTIAANSVDWIWQPGDPNLVVKLLNNDYVIGPPEQLSLPQGWIGFRCVTAPVNDILAILKRLR